MIISKRVGDLGDGTEGRGGEGWTAVAVAGGGGEDVGERRGEEMKPWRIIAETSPDFNRFSAASAIRVRELKRDRVLRRRRSKRERKRARRHL